MKRKNACILIFTLFITGCSLQSQRTEIIFVDFSAMNDIACVIENVIPLETTNDALIDRNYTFHVTSSQYIVGDRHKIIGFSKQGKVKNIISPLGDGPNELTYINQFYADDASLMIMDIGKKRIMEFDYNGQFIMPHPVDDIIHHIFACFNGFYLFDNQSQATAEGNVLSIVDREGKIVKDTIPVIAEGISYGRNKFQIFKDYALYLPTMNNIIYKIDKSANVSGAYQLDFGAYWLDMETSNKVVANSNGNAFALWKYIANHNKIGFLNFFDTQKWLFLNFEKQDKRYNWYYNKASKKQYLIECNGKSVAASDIIGVENNKFIAGFQPDDYLNSTAVPKLDNLKYDDNLVVVIFKMENEGN
ncbi:MAG: 6-bladed beta-propeller [Prevotellaceae bacterium]|jgi:hypothetical protein|nr:6-bladed beta-propeller [Prevotellaceae bacterium]